MRTVQIGFTKINLEFTFDAHGVKKINRFCLTVENLVQKHVHYCKE